MMFLNAFILGGILCLLGQLMLMYTKVTPPTLLGICLALGGILTPFGVMTALSNWAGGGMLVMIFGAGQAIAGSAGACVSGNWAPAIMIVLLFAILVVLGIISGLIHARMHEGVKSAAPSAVPE